MSLRQLLRTDTVGRAQRRLPLGGARTPYRRSDVLVASQVGCSLLLLIVTGGMGRTLMNLRHVDPGFDPAGAVAITVNASARGAGAVGDARRTSRRSTTASRRMPQVARVTLSQIGLLTRGMTTGTVDVPGLDRPRADDERWVRLFFVGPDFFETAGMRIVAGETLGPREMADGRVAVVTQAVRGVLLRRRAECRRPPRQPRRPHRRRRRRRRYNTFRDGPVRAMFLPFTQAPARSTMTFIVRPAGDQRQAIAAVTAAIRTHDPVLKVTAAPMSRLVDATMGRERFAASIAADADAARADPFLRRRLRDGGVRVSERRQGARRAVRARRDRRATSPGWCVRGPMRVALAGIVVGAAVRVRVDARRVRRCCSACRRSIPLTVLGFGGRRC